MSSMCLRFALLGSVQIRRDGLQVPIGAAKQRLLLTCLLLDPNRPVSIERLFAAL